MADLRGHDQEQEASFVRLASALAMERNEKWLAKRYVAALDAVLNPGVVALLAA